MERIPKYETPTGVPCTQEEEKLIDSLVRLSRKWAKNGKDLMLFSWAGRLVVVKKSALEEDTTQLFSVDEAIVADIYGISNDGGDPDTRML